MHFVGQDLTKCGVETPVTRRTRTLAHIHDGFTICIDLTIVQNYTHYRILLSLFLSVVLHPCQFPVQQKSLSTIAYFSFLRLSWPSLLHQLFGTASCSLSYQDVLLRKKRPTPVQPIIPLRTLLPIRCHLSTHISQRQHDSSHCYNLLYDRISTTSSK
jgi:hypothetical protein